MQTETDFYPRPPRGGRRHTQAMAIPAAKFLSTPSARRATRVPRRPPRHQGISIHALREEGDPHHRGRRPREAISIHALREEGDLTNCMPSNWPIKFLSTPSARRATLMMSIANTMNTFLSTPSARRATTSCSEQSKSGIFLSTPSARRATAKTETKSLFSYKLYNILHGFRRALIYNGSKNYPNHAK